jgi:cardiolipin synthase
VIARAATALALAAALAAGCARVEPTHVLPALALGEPSFFPTFEAHTLAPVMGGNRVDLLLNGEEIFPALLEAIRSARTSLTYAQYSYEDGAVARDIAAALAERCRAGVGVKVLLDAFGTLRMPRAYVREMRASGCHVVYFRPLNPLRLLSVNYRNHRRIVVVDGRIGFTGGAGVSRKWMGDGRTERHWRDTDVRVEGPVVDSLQAAFAENWLEATGEVLGGEAYFPSRTAPAGRTYAQVVRSSPIAGRYAMYSMYRLAIASAQRSVYITNPYFVPDDALAHELFRAVERGVRVVLLLPGAIDHTIVRGVSRVLFGSMLAAGIEIYEYQPALLHAKTMVIDGRWATVGSANLINRSFVMDDEINVVVHDADVARRLEQIFLEDLEYARRVDDAEWRARGLGRRLLEVLAVPVRALGIF